MYMVALWLALGASHGIYYYFLGGMHNNLESDRFYIDDWSSGNTFISSYNDAGNSHLELAGVLDYDYDHNHIIVVREDRTHYDCKNGITMLANKRLQYLLIDKKTNKILSTYDEMKFLKKLKQLHIRLSFKKAQEDLRKSLKGIQANSLQPYTDCSPISTYTLEEY